MTEPTPLPATVQEALHTAITRVLDEAGVRPEVLRGMCIEVGFESFRAALSSQPSAAAAPAEATTTMHSAVRRVMKFHKLKADFAADNVVEADLVHAVLDATPPSAPAAQPAGTQAFLKNCDIFPRDGDAQLASGTLMLDGYAITPKEAAQPVALEAQEVQQFGYAQFLVEWARFRGQWAQFMGTTVIGQVNPAPDASQPMVPTGPTIEVQVGASSLPQEVSAPTEMSPEFTDTARAALLWVLWHHQGGSSPVGQPLRFALGMGQHDHLNEHQVAEAKRWQALTKSRTEDFHARAPGSAPSAEDERAAFESWAHASGFNIDRDKSEKYKNYHRATTRFARDGWLSALAWASRNLTAAAPRRALSEATRVFTYKDQPTDNVDAWRLGEACRKAADDPRCGDYIDRGLILLRELQARGYGVVGIAPEGGKDGAS